jgi:hypothetical protein
LVSESQVSSPRTKQAKPSCIHAVKISRRGAATQSAKGNLKLGQRRTGSPLGDSMKMIERPQFSASPRLCASHSPSSNSMDTAMPCARTRLHALHLPAPPSPGPEGRKKVAHGVSRGSDPNRKPAPAGRQNRHHPLRLRSLNVLGEVDYVPTSIRRARLVYHAVPPCGTRSKVQILAPQPISVG